MDLANGAQQSNVATYRGKKQQKDSRQMAAGKRLASLHANPLGFKAAFCLGVLLW